ncbi:MULTISPECIES: hypothetical protein [Streptosporangium]|uniref:Ribosome-binding protein aMBF1 (Putative translation factor) n=1 Tax=Streptosporangium brasiliense TaxID=47480 RepID=A0ABT9RM31_9ACTN|nr:hypothetical protein [Streptosporangium brasiliense]MDP9870315.1 ribosome-binding protein aMBF1 (putative translation factor) [Streptosporangium brasiliense]
MESETQIKGKAKMGRPSKGPRKLVKGEVPVPYAQRFKQEAERRGMSQADLLAAILANVDWEAMSLSA